MAKMVISYDAQQLCDPLVKRFPYLSFYPGFERNFLMKLLGWPDDKYCCGDKTILFHATYKSSALPYEMPFYACKWCGKCW